MLLVTAEVADRGSEGNEAAETMLGQFEEIVDKGPRLLERK